jgi:hypothetical protein
MKSRKTALTVLALASVLTVGKAQSVTYSGFIDAYYSFNAAKPVSQTNEFRNFDKDENQFTLSLAEVEIQKAVSSASPIGFRADIDYGSTDKLVFTNGNSTNAYLQQAYVTALLPLGSGLTVDVGKFVTHMGYEVIESKDNANYSRSFLFAYAIPYYHTGMRISYPVLSNLTAAVHVVNGWNDLDAVNHSKSIGATINYAPTSSTGIIFNGMWGHENISPSDTSVKILESGARNVYDLTVTQTLSEKLTLAINADYGEAGTSEGLKTWKGVAGYLKYTVDTLNAVALRGEVYADPEGYTLANYVSKTTVKEVTLTLEHKLFNQLLLRGEVRDDFSNTPLFDKTIVGSEKTQLTFLIGAVVTF